MDLMINLPFPAHVRWHPRQKNKNKIKTSNQENKISAAFSFSFCGNKKIYTEKDFQPSIHTLSCVIYTTCKYISTSPVIDKKICLIIKSR